MNQPKWWWGLVALCCFLGMILALNLGQRGLYGSCCSVFGYAMARIAQ